MTWIEKLLDFLERRIPWLLIGYNLGKKADSALNKEKVKLELELESKTHAEEILKHNAGLSDDELKSEILRGRPGSRNGSKEEP